MRWESVAGVACAVAGAGEMYVGGVRSPVVLGSGVLAAAALAARPRHETAAPLVSLALFALPVVVLGRQVPLLGEAPNSIALMVAWLLAVAFTGAAYSPRRAAGGLVATLALCALYGFGPGSPSGSSGNDVVAAVLFSGVVPWLAGFALARQRRARAVQALLDDSELVAAAERSRIAREVHDLVAHTVSVMVVQAEAAEALMATRPDQSVESLHAVQAAGRRALAEMRRTVAALRAGDVAAAAQGMSAVPALLEAVRSAGLPVTVVTEGEPGPLPGEVDRSAYQLLQESLTNVLRHSDRSGATVRLTYSPGHLEVCVIDEGRPVRRRLPGGHGLAGVRERVAAIGGVIDAGPTADGRHLVRAVLPVAAP